MKPTRMLLGALAVSAVTLLGANRLEAQTGVIYYDPFTGAAGSILDFTAPEDHGGIGAADWWGPQTGMTMDGSVLGVTAASKSAFLEFIPAELHKYRLSVDMQTIHSGNDWFAVGFARDKSMDEAFSAGSIGASGWFLLRGNNAASPVHTFTGYATAGGGAVDFYSGPHNLAVVLDTTTANWTFEYFIDGVSVRGPVAFDTAPDVNPAINYVGMGGYNTARGSMDNFKLEIIAVVDVVPAVQTQPADATVVMGGSANFSVAASGARPLAYQWFKDGSPLAGETSSTLTLRDLTTADSNAKIKVQVTNDSGNVFSREAVLTVLNVAGPIIHKFSFNDGSANDSIGGVSGALKGDALITGGELLLNGSNATYAALGDYVMPPSGNATVAAWFRTSSTVGNWSRVFDFGSGTGNYYFFTPRGGSPSHAQLGLKTGDDPEASISYTPPLNDNTDHLVVAVIDSTPTATGANGTIVLYLDGVAVGTNDLNGTSALANLASGPQNFFGKSQFNTADAYFKGAIDEVRVYNTALSPTEIQALAPDTNPLAAPVIEVEPQALTAALGSPASFSVSVRGSKPLTYQWRLNDQPIAGATGNVYTIDSADLGDFGSYDVVVTNSEGSDTSAAAALTRTFWSYAAWNDDASAGIDTAYLYTHAYNFASSANTDVNGITFTGVPGGNPTVPGVFTVAGSGSVFGNDANNVTGASQIIANDFIYGGAPGTLTVNGLNPGQEYVLTLFSVAFDPPGVRRIQFSAPNGQNAIIDQDTYDNNNGIRISLEYVADESGSITITNNQTANNATFHFYGFANRLLKTISETAPPEILSQPAPLSVPVGAPAQFAVTAAGPAPLSYQWRFNDTAIPDATTATYSIASADTSHAGNYSVVVTNNYGSVTSLVARLSVVLWKHAAWNDDATSGIDPAYLYTHAYNLASLANTDINGVTFTGVDRTLSVPGSFWFSGLPNVFRNDVNNITGGSQLLATDFLYGGSPALLNLQGLTPGGKYLLTLYSVGWEAAGRRIRFRAADDQELIIDQDTYGNDNGIVISLEYTAGEDGTFTITNSPITAGSTFHTYGFANRFLEIVPATAAPAIVRQPASANVALGSTTELSVVAAGAEPLTYQWKLNGADIAGATSATHSIASVEAAHLGNYTVVVSNGNGTTPSVVARLSQARWSFADWSNDESSGVDTQYAYTHAYSFANISSAQINGLTFTGVAGGNPAVANSFAVTGVPSVFNNDGNNITGGSRTLANDFIYGGNPGRITLEGLVPGRAYLLTIYSVGWEDAGRVILFNGADNQKLIADQDTYLNNNGIRILYEYIADASGSASITTRQVGIGTFHMYGFSNRELALPGPELQITQAASKVTVSWPAAISGFILESAPSLPGAPWSPVSGVENNSVTVDVTPGNRFFRLRKP